MERNNAELETLVGLLEERLVDLEETVEGLLEAKKKRRDYMRKYMRKRRAKK